MESSVSVKKMKLLLLFPTFICFYTTLIDFVYSQDVLGCGGFIKADFPIDFSLVEVKLYTKQGALKYQTDCAPNNGYYLIPVYDKGDYVIKVEPPEGWYFEPNTVALNIDGVSDVCSQSKDINFYFKGFFVKGKVVSRGSNDGPAGVKISLNSETDLQKPIQESLSLENGLYQFEKVLPGKYVITGSHPDIVFDKKSINIHVEKAIVTAPENNLVVAGYNLKGCVIGDDGEAIHGVHFILFGKPDAALLPRQCETGLPKAYNTKSSSFKTELSPLCYVTSLKDGCFNFPAVVPGDYAVVPFYRSQNIKFDVVPSSFHLKMGHSAFNIQPGFKVEGFSVSGRVLTSIEGKGLPNAEIFLNGKILAKSKEDGTFHLENMRAGSYEIQVQAEKMKFEKQNVKINPNAPNLQDIIPSEFKVCGRIDGDEIAKKIEHQITFTSADVTPKRFTTVNSPDGNFCTWLPSGQYMASVAGKRETTLSIVFKPNRLKVIVKDAPVSSVKFLQYKGTISGRVDCLQSCADHVQITLTPLIVSNYQVVSQTVQVTTSSKFSFSNVVPGKYEVSILNDAWCWDIKSQTIEILDNDVADIVFKHKGYWLTVASTHSTAVRYRIETSKSKPEADKENNSGNLELVKGTNKFCLDKPGVYTLQPVGCHVFSKDQYIFDSSKPIALSLDAVKHLLTGVVFSAVNTSEIRISVKGIDDEKNEEAVIGPLKGVHRIKSNDYEYQFSHWATPHRKIELRPSSPELLFYPDHLMVSVLDDCIQTAVEIVGRKGLFLEGQISPPLAGVKITVFAEDGSFKPMVLETPENGRYRVGPLHGHSKYEVQAEKLGYILSKGKELGHFTAFKLAEIVVTVVEEGTKASPLAGVILSVSGAEDYRHNRLTQEDGKIVFSGLGPGQYFLRAMMKEYQFDPPSKMVQVSEGEGVNVVLKGKRVAFSCFGSITTLVGEPEKGIVVEAIGKGDCSMYQEEVTSEADGSFRIRGLKPNCEYGVGLKSSAEANSHIERSTPTSHLVKISKGDVGPVTLIIFRPVLLMDISVMVITSKEYFSSLKVRLTGENGTQLVRSSSHSNFFQFLSLPMREQQMSLSLEPALSRNMYSYSLPPEISFKANETYRHFKFYFNPTSSSGENEIGHGSFLVLPLALLVALVLVNHSKVVPFINKSIDMVRSLNNPANRSQEDSPPISSFTASSSSNVASSFEPSIKKKVKSRKI